MTINSLFFQGFGGKKAFLSTLWHSTTGRAGGFAQYRTLDWPQVSRLVFVCKGNICRSAFAAEKARTLGRHAVSAGLAADPGKAADSHAQRAAGRRKISLSEHRSQSVAGLCPQAGDLLIAFEPEQAESLAAIAADLDGVQVTLLGLWHPESWWAYLHDPYGQSDRYFDQCFDRIEQSLDGLLRQWNAPRSPSGKSIPGA